MPRDPRAWLRTIPFTTAFLASQRPGWHAIGNCSRNPHRRACREHAIGLPFPLDLQCTRGLEPVWRVERDFEEPGTRPSRLFPRGFDRWQAMQWRSIDEFGKP